MNNVKRCPFCKGNNTILQVLSDNLHRITCLECGAHGPPAQGRSQCDEDAIEKAVGRWNFRGLGIVPVPTIVHRN